MGSVGIRFSTVDSLQEVKHDNTFATLGESLKCIKIHARVRENTEIAVLVDFMNGLRKIASKHLVGLNGKDRQRSAKIPKMAKMPNKYGKDEFNLAKMGQNRQISPISV